MSKRNRGFADNFEVYISDNLYYIEVEGYKTPNELYDWSDDNVITRLIMTDEDGNEVKADHPDYEDLIDEVYVREYQTDEEEDFGYYEDDEPYWNDDEELY